jgi:hypothetical protein
MTDSELNQILKSARLPERPAPFWEACPRQVIRRLRQAPGPERHEPRRQFSLALWGIGFATACLAIGFAFGFWHGRRNHAEDGLLAEDGKLVREVAALFPNRVRAIISDNTGVRLVLSDLPDVPASAPLFLKICRGKKCQSIITFSGQEIQVAGQEFEVLADARGNVFLVGHQGVWTTAEPNRRLSGLKIEGQALRAVL